MSTCVTLGKWFCTENCRRMRWLWGGRHCSTGGSTWSQPLMSGDAGTSTSDTSQCCIDASAGALHWWCSDAVESWCSCSPSSTALELRWWCRHTFRCVILKWCGTGVLVLHGRVTVSSSNASLNSGGVRRELRIEPVDLLFTDSLGDESLNWIFSDIGSDATLHLSSGTDSSSDVISWMSLCRHWVKDFGGDNWHVSLKCLDTRSDASQLLHRWGIDSTDVSLTVSRLRRCFCNYSVNK